MVTKSNRIQFYINKELKEVIKQNFNTEDTKEIQNLILKFLENGDVDTLTLKDQYLLERILKLREQRPEQLRKLKLQNDILEAKRKFLYNFKTELSDEGTKTLTKSKNQQYGFATSQSYDENIQLKKNFFIDKHSDGSYVGVCKVCTNFVTAVCSTSREAEGDIELHLESVHSTGLYQR